MKKVIATVLNIIFGMAIWIVPAVIFGDWVLFFSWFPAMMAMAMIRDAIDDIN